MEVITVNNLTKKFSDKKRGEIYACDKISFSVNEKEIFGLLGPNGAGKTTALRLLATVLTPSDGTASVFGHDLLKYQEAIRRKTGFLSGDMGHYHRLTPKETLRYYGRLHNVDEQILIKRIDDLFTKLGIHEFENTKIDKLSTGMKQKVAVARTLVHDPTMIILDEPTLGLDVPTARIVEEFILEARAAGKTIILSTHIMEEAEQLCDRIAIINKGKIKAIGTIDELKRQTGESKLRQVFLKLLDMTS